MEMKFVDLVQFSETETPQTPPIDRADLRDRFSCVAASDLRILPIRPLTAGTIHHIESLRAKFHRAVGLAFFTLSVGAGRKVTIDDSIRRSIDGSEVGHTAITFVISRMNHLSIIRQMK
jgi:hypothetical protein